jgi:hypothetical protein
MKLYILLPVLLLSGCATAQVDHVLSNLDRDCTRHYAGAVGGVLAQATVTFQNDCKPSGEVVTPATP